MEDLKDIAYFNLSQLKKLVKQIENNPKALKEVTSLMLGKDKTIAMRAAWTLTHVSYSSPDNIYPLLPEFIKFLRNETQNSGAIRSVLRIFPEIDLPEKYCSEIFDFCISYAKNTTQPHAVRVYAINTMVEICKKYPDLKPEVELILNELKSFPQSPSMNASIRNATKVLSKL